MKEKFNKILYRILQGKVLYPMFFWLGMVNWLIMFSFGIILGINLFVALYFGYCSALISWIVFMLGFGERVDYEEWKAYTWRDITGFKK